MITKNFCCLKSDLTDFPMEGEDFRIGPFVGRCIDVADDGGEYVVVTMEIDMTPKCTDCILYVDESDPDSKDMICICDECVDQNFYWPKRGR